MRQQASAVLHRLTYRVPMADVDAAQVLYYATPFRWKELAFTDWLARTGHPLVGLLAAGQGFPCVSAAAQYYRPVRLDDVVEFVLLLEKTGRTSLELRLDVIGPDGEVVVRVTTTNVWLNGSRPAPLPAWLRSFEAGDDGQPSA